MGCSVIDQETIERIREQTDIVSLIGESVKLERAGRQLKGLCPFHKEKTPSFHVNPETGRYHCFGCHESGDVFKYVQETEGLTFVESVRHLAERAGITIVERRSSLEQSEQDEARRRKQELYDVNNAAAVFFERQLSEHPLGGMARAELARRGLVSESPTDWVADALQSFRVGYAPYGWNGLANHFAQLGMSPRAAETVGLVLPRRSGGGYYDRFRHRLVFAVLDLQGRVVAFSGRALDEPEPDDLRAHGIEATNRGQEPDPKIAKYINSTESPVYRKGSTVFGLFQARQHVRQAERCILVEGNFDVLSLHARGIKNVAAPLGTAFTEQQAVQIKRFAPTLVFLFDGDRAGKAAVARGREACGAAGLTAKVASLPDGLDPDDLVRQQGPDAIRKRVAAARGMLEYLIDSALDHLPPRNDSQARLARVQEVAELIASEQDPTVRQLASSYANEVVARLGIPEAATFRVLWNQVREVAQRGRSASRSAPDPGTRWGRDAGVRDPRETIGREIVGALLDYPALLSKAEVVARLGHIEGDAAAAIAALRRAWEAHVTSADDGFVSTESVGLRTVCGSLEQLLAKLPPSIHQFAAARLAAPQLEGFEDARAKLLGDLDRLEALGRNRQRADVVEQLRQAGAAGEEDHEIAMIRRQEEAEKATAAQILSRSQGRGNASER